MTMQVVHNPGIETKADSAAIAAPPFGANEMRLSARQWLAAIVIFLGLALGLPWIWTRIERFDISSDYRIPYALSADYWLYRQRIERLSATVIPVLGDSVVWGEYVRPDGTLTHFLSREAGSPGRFANCGVNGLFPLSMEGLVASYAGAITHRKVILHCNVLWMSSPKADLSTDKEETFNHAKLVPQFFPRIPCYRADASTRLGAIAERDIGLYSWVSHVDSVYFDQQSIPRWTLEEDSSDPPRSPNAWRNPLAQITLQAPGEPQNDPLRGPSSPRHKPWNADGAAPTHFDWVDLDASLQWHAFQRTVRLLRDRGNDVLVVLGPFNDSMVAADQLPTLNRLRAGITAWLTANDVPHITPEALPGELYADASHPLTQGYALLAARIYQNPEFQTWLHTQRRTD